MRPASLQTEDPILQTGRHKSTHLHLRLKGKITSSGDSRFLFGICPCFFWFSPWHTIDISWPMGPDLCFLKSETEKSDTPEPRAAEKSDEFQSYCRFESGGPPVSLILEPGSAAITKKRIPGGHAIGHFLCPPRNPVREISDERPLYSPERPGYSPEPSL